MSTVEWSRSLLQENKLVAWVRGQGQGPTWAPPGGHNPQDLVESGLLLAAASGLGPAILSPPTTVSWHPWAVEPQSALWPGHCRGCVSSVTQITHPPHTPPHPHLGAGRVAASWRPMA